MKRAATLLPWIVIGVITLACLVMNFGMEPMCDDIGYGTGYADYYGGRLAYYPRWILRHWWFSNGRLANFLAPLWLWFLPLWVVRIVGALMTGAFLSLTVRLACPGWREVPLRAMIVLSVACLGFTWWDGMLMYDFAFNYIWAGALGLLSWLLIFKEIHSSWKIAVAAMICLAGGMMHESMSLPLCAAIITALVLGSRLSRSGRLCTAAFFVGTLVALTSLGIWSRAMRGDIPDDPIWLLMLKSAYIAIAAVIIWCSVKGDRKGWPWIVATLVAAIFCAVGGKVGRGGWFVNLYALIGLSLWIRPRLKSMALEGILALVLIVHYVGTAAWQWRFGEEMRHVLDLYRESPDGVVMADITDDSEAPWWTLRKARAVPDADDFYALSSLTDAHGDSLRPLVIVPKAMRGLEPWQLATPREIAAGVKASLQRPGMSNPLGVSATEVVTPYLCNDTVIYVTTRRDIDPGDRDHQLIPMGETPYIRHRLELLNKSN